jgi:hypothetical protein
MEYGEFVNRKDAMMILGIKKHYNNGEIWKDGKIKVYRPFSNRTRYKVSELLIMQNKGWSVLPFVFINTLKNNSFLQ